jgi:eukaryotic-like serine/threonine-protein kinase
MACATCGFDHAPPTACPPDPLLGQVLDGRYRIDGVLGRGGMGAVYLAQQLNVDREVAIKVLTAARQGDQNAERRFAREAKIIAQLRHPHTITLFDFGETPGGSPYLVMERLHGMPLSDALKDGPMAPVRVARLLAQAGDALAYAHSQGVIHRDLKPDNLFLERAGGGDHLKLIDFGIAWFAGASVQTATGEVFGTPTFMPPEQARGATVDHRADLYSLGAVAWSCVSGHPPFRGQTPLAVLLQHISDPPPPLDRAVVDGALVDLIEALLAKEPAHRPADAREVARRAQEIERRLTGGAAPPDMEPGPMDPDATVVDGGLRPVAVDWDEETLYPEAPAAPVAPKSPAPEVTQSPTGPRKTALPALLAAVAAAAAAAAWWLYR